MQLSVSMNFCVGLILIIYHNQLAATNAFTYPTSQTSSLFAVKLNGQAFSRSKNKSLSKLTLQSTQNDELYLSELGKKITDAMITSDMFKDVKVAVSPSKRGHRLGLFASQELKANEVAISIPYDNLITLTADHCEKVVLKSFIPENFDGWTGDAGLIAMNLLYELARSVASGSTTESGHTYQPKRSPAIQSFMSIWVQSLPFQNNEYDHPISTWDEDSIETLQLSSTKKIYRVLDDIEEDAAWWEERVWSQNRDIFPEKVTIPGVGQRDCFNEVGFKWAMAMVNSRSIFVDGMLRLVPIADYANHYDDINGELNIEAQEIQPGFFGAFGTSKGVQIRSPLYKNNKNKSAASVSQGHEIFVSYGPKTPADYILEHGFVPKNMIQVASQKQQKSLSSRSKSANNRGLCEVAELTFEIPTDDRFYDDKLDILEFESPLGNPSQSFDVTSVDDPDPVMIQFLRLMHLEGMDAFLLESIFRKEVWDFMDLPVSEKNEEMVVNQIIKKCKNAMEEMDESSSLNEDEALFLGKPNIVEEENSSYDLICATIRILERRALRETILFMEREGEALDLKEYYQERRLKDLGLDSEWNEDENNPDVGWGQTRAPGSGDLDW